MPVTSDQWASAASRSRPSWRYTRTRSRASSIAKNRRNHAQKNRTIVGSVLANSTCAVGLGALARVERGAGGKERGVAERADALDALGVQRRDLGELRLVERDADVAADRFCASTG